MVSETPALWTVETGTSLQRVPAGRAYFYANPSRGPRDSVVVQITLAGHIEYRDAAGTQRVEPGHMLLFSHDEASSYGRYGDLSRWGAYACAWVSLRGAGLGEHWSLVRRRYGSVIRLPEADRLLLEMRDLLHLAGPRVSTPATDMARAVHDFVMRLIDHAHQSRSERQSPVERAVEQMMRQPDLALSLKQVADRHGCSREHLTRLFTQRTGTSPGKFVAQSRVRRAMALLLDSDLPVNVVAQQAGFRSTHTLIRRVRQLTGQTPAMWRQQQRGRSGQR